MNLREWLFKNQIKIKCFATQLGVDRTYIHKLMAGNRKPSRPFMNQIESLTLGEINDPKHLLDKPPVNFSFPQVSLTSGKKRAKAKSL